MITTKHAGQILAEEDKAKQDVMVDKLKEQEAKDLLKLCLQFIGNGGRSPGDAQPAKNE